MPPAAPTEAAPAAAPTVELAVIVPTFNEIGNLDPLIDRLAAALAPWRWEVIFVDDDSPDGTAAAVRARALIDPRVRCVHRIGRRGLASACIEGIQATAAPLVAVMDADLQHDEALLPTMIAALADPDAGLDIVIGSRNVDGANADSLTPARRLVTGIATRAARLVVGTDLADPMSGYFMLRRSVFAEVVRGLSGRGFKILLDILASAPRPLRYRELPFQFRPRHAGESKLDPSQIWEYGVLLLTKLFGGVVPIRFVLFSLVGGLGTVVHMVALGLGFGLLGLSFVVSQVVATVLAMTSNFVLNNLVTYRDRRLKGRGLVIGLLSFYVICAIGAVANVGIARWMFAGLEVWWAAGLAGALVGAVWNYAMASLFTWRITH